ncbi:MAG: aminoacyl-tRNA hydrolase [Planctomycetes bacterium]|nr:aminoacyl-tRNA hydrolase [Planctomycetota bacterium]
MLIVTNSIQIPDDELQFTFARSSGPGGQNVNKVNSKAVLRWSPVTSPNLPADVRERFLTRFGARLTTEGELLLSSQQSRDQARNMEDCLERLKEMILSVARKPVARRPTKPTRGSQRRRLEGKRRQSGKKQDRRRPSSGDD